MLRNRRLTLLIGLIVAGILLAACTGAAPAEEEEAPAPEEEVEEEVVEEEAEGVPDLGGIERVVSLNLSREKVAR